MSSQLQNIQDSRQRTCNHEIIEEDTAKTITKIVDIAKEILLITERGLPIDGNQKEEQDTPK
ncbi:MULTISPECIES: hypothetical protein [Sporomusa]|jgi:hypothetical protein|uniref:hypothetical protein n=1 Tax=Sporomusa TaxID=2375 RepID=UPI002CD6B53F|nr:hypothetical protein [Sporomusa sphaeroides]HML32424.1 hypothetical protein [Sporomusa sphaeroides]